MQPTFRQTPPRAAPLSTSTTFLPRSAARNAAVYPPGPAPRTSTSVVWFSTSASEKTESEHQAPDIFQHPAQVADEPGGQRPADDPVVVGHLHRHTQPPHERR